MIKYFLIYILIINIMAFIAMWVDKHRAINGDKRNRISEKTLFTYALLLGSVGIYTGMYTFRHKTKHMKFVIGIPIILIINCISIYYIISYVLK